MTIPSNPISSEEDSSDQLIQGESSFPDQTDERVTVNAPDGGETALRGSELVRVDDAEAEALAVSEQVIDSSYTDLDEPGEIQPQAPAAKQTKPAYIAVLTIIGLIILCCLMAGVMFLLLRQQIFATGL
ncbi:MAG: hypothetical protein V2J07_09375 [Anaerolineae bacterium]|jgi:hypothetical protein|nr:hypothetical protein [Anaerolineae bacterium]